MTARHPDRVAHPVTGAELAVVRAWPRRDQHVLLELATPSGERLAGQWFADAVRRADVVAATSGAIDVPAHGVVLQPDGADRKLPALAGLVARPGSRLLVHRPGRRAVVLLDGDRGRCYAKVLPPGAEVALAGRLTALAAALRGVAEVPRPLDRPLGDGVLAQSELPGPTLYEAGPSSGLLAGWERLGAALRRLHGTPPSTVAVTATHDAADEEAVTVRWLRAAAVSGLLPPVDVAGPLTELRTGPPGPVGLLHRDLHDKQAVLQPGGRLGLLDLDTVAAGERALDVANVLVHLELRVAQEALTPSLARSARSAFLAGLDPDDATLARAPAYERATRLRLAGVYAFRPRWRELSRTLLAAASP
ncbi:phosphotransferase [Jiangella muralis]|uniref:phosphotransferase n=1 Tax=Jiangella muralis TaxID=702383 RepID=UPI00069D33A7|nr:phosphotransferase [Jiangella muralis]